MESTIIGATVLYVLGMRDVNEIQRGRRDGRHLGNAVKDGDIFPAVIVRLNVNEFGLRMNGVNLRVLLDGSDFLWVTSRKYDDKKTQGTWHFIPKEAALPLPA